MCVVFFMRLGEFRSITRDLDNKLVIRLSCYSEEKGVTLHNLEWDMSNDNEIYLRIVDDSEDEPLFKTTEELLDCLRKIRTTDNFEEREELIKKVDKYIKEIDYSPITITDKVELELIKDFAKELTK